jgi:ligand-binding sensor domain-containing protein/signal transduction histidine kinase
VQTVYTEKDGLPQASVLSIAQTPDGYYWLGTQEGLARFDGVSFQVFDSTNTPALAHNDIAALYLDSRARLWISSRGGGVARFENGRFTSLTKKDGLIDDNVLAVYEDSQKRIWFATNEGCTVLEPGGKLWNLSTPEGLPKGAVNDVKEGPDGSMWIATEGGLVHWRQGSATVYDSQTLPSLTVNDIRTLAFDSSGALWVGTWGGGLLRYARGQWENIPSDRPKQMIADTVEDRDKNLWVALGDGGLGRVEDGRLVAYGKGDGLPNENGLVVFEDREGNLLLGLGPGGLVVLRDAPFVTYDARDGLPDPSIRTIYQDIEGDLWIGLQADGLGRMRNGEISMFGSDSGIAGGTRSILDRPQGGLYVASLKEGVLVFEEGRVTGTLAHNGETLKISVRAMLSASDGSVWFGSIGQGLFRQKDGEVTIFTTADGLASNRILSLAEGPDGSIWIGAWGGGLTRYHQNQFEIVGGFPDLESKAVTSFKIDPDGTVWLGTYGLGILCYKDGRFTPILRANGLTDDSAFVLIEADGYLWATGNRGVYRTKKKELVDFVEGHIERIHSQSFGEGDGLKSRECNGGAQPAGWQARDGRLWFPTIAGLAVVDPKTIAPREFVPPPLIIRFVVDEKILPAVGQKRIEPGVEKLEIHYTAPTLSTPEGVNFRFRLKGFERDWVDAGERRVAYYTNLDPGPYRFEVSVINADGKIGTEIATFDFYLAPALWQTPWFRIAVGMCCLGLIWALVMLRLRTIKKRNILLEIKVAKRTAELEQAHARIVKLEKEAIEKQMAGGFAHEIRNALAGAKLMILRALKAEREPKPETANPNESEQLLNLFLLLRSKLDKESLAEVAGILKKVNNDKQLTEQALKLSLASVDSCLYVTGRILEYSEIGNHHAGLSDVPLRDAMEKLLEEHRPRIEKLGISVNLDIPETSVIRCAAPHLDAIFAQLISNAIDAMAEEAGSEKSKRLQIREVPSSSRRIIEVIDTGKGISKQEQDKIFAPFYTTKPSTGTGLGLGIATKYLSLYNGRIEVSSETGVGTCFSVIFP